MSAVPLLEVAGLSMQFGGLVVNHEIGFSVAPAEIIGLIGPNGAGKTTLFNCIAGFLTPTAGQIRFQGRVVTGIAPEQAAALGIARTFQIVRIFQSLTVLENVMVGALLRTRRVRLARQRAAAALAFVGLEARADTRAGALTVSEQKRLEIARALATEPSLLLIDEAMAGLNQTEVREASALIQRLSARGIACIVVEHVMEGIMPIADRMLVLERGVKIADGTPAEIARDPAVIAAYLGE